MPTMKDDGIDVLMIMIVVAGLLDAFYFWMCVVVPRLSPYRTPWSIQVIIMMI